ncbi:MAG: trypsin-like peptidase domain-containing protein [Roseomonas sp.]|nr:trypsin-like peptidase domain-containing protein [Roseomonas sp.]MCA3289014.1 trypsin-like peptidase domain-containing protein [Roseomonas sp.]MCA3293614.1 trypsin-like peptidase domain-containing protein [Roseomonas sp.]MCA3343682.1 trypsin-like peptidase domain-containing protein [Roseomonas sp.]
MAAPRLLLKTDLAGLQPLLLRGQTVHALHQRLTDQLNARGAPAALFAEPIAGAGAISWYGEAAGEPQPLPSLSSARRAEAEAALTRQLQALEPLLDDAEIGPLLRRALVLPSADSILVLDGQIILTGWGLAPREIAEDPAALAAQTRRVLGPYSQRLAAAPDNFLAAGPMPIQAPPPAAAPNRTAAPPPPPAPPAPMMAPAPRQPASGSAVWLLPLLALVALIFLALGFWLAWTQMQRDLAGQQQTVSIVDDAATRNAIRLQRETNEALERDLERMRRLAATPNVCTPEGPLGLNPPPERQPVRPEAVPPAIPQRQGEAPRPFSGSLAQLLEHATVMIASAGPAGIGHGSGFFISGDTILTNAHVVQQADRNQIFVTSRAMGRAVKAQLVSMTRGAGGGPVEPGMLDVALLRLPEAVPGAQPLALTPTADKLLDVVAAGYPASVVQVEQGMRELQQGRLGTPPELVLTRGSISTIQRLENGLVVMPHSADISPGNSGGPLVDTCGRVVGINTFVSYATQVADRVKYAQKTENILPWLQQQNVQAAVQTEACQPVVPGLPATPQPPAATPAAPTAPTTPAPPAGAGAPR